MLDRPFFTIIIPTYNSEKTLGYTLQSIRDQEYDQNELEILVIDGGSTDDTLKVAAQYNVTVLDNPHRLPEHAKAIGVSHASGRYVVRMDSDEEFSYPEQLKDKKDFYLKHPEIKVLLSNMYIRGRKDICGICASYMNILGDPFSYFIYSTKIDKCITYKKHIVEEDGRYMIMSFGGCDLLPLGDSGTCSYSLDYIREHYPNSYDGIEFTCGTYDIVIGDTGFCGCIKGDNIRHNCRSDIKTYFKKLKFRVINNVFNKGESGFSSRPRSSAGLRKILFCLYALLIPVPVLDSVRLAVNYRDPSFLLHFIYLYYVMIQIIAAYGRKLLGGVRRNTSYG